MLHARKVAEIAILVLAALAAGCRPEIPVCEPASTRCNGQDRVEVCSPEGQWIVAERCGDFGPGVCLASSRSRALYEVDGMKPAILLRHKLQPLDANAGAIALQYASKLETYRCTDADQEAARTLLLPFVVSVLEGPMSLIHRRYPQVEAICDVLSTN